MLLIIAKLAHSTYYYQVSQFDKPDKYADVKVDILSIFRDENKCRRGYRVITEELKKTRLINHKTVLILMREMGIYCMVRAKKYSSYKGKIGLVAPNLLNREFDAEHPNEKWVTDVTEFHLFGQKLYLSAILDLYNREIKSYTICHRPRMSMVLNMLDEAVGKLPHQASNLMLHSDQGWQYQMKKYQNKLKANKITQSMSRKATCLDNAVMENFFGILKTELLYIQEFNSIEHFIKELHEYIYYYNNLRTKKKYMSMSPIAYRTKFELSA